MTVLSGSQEQGEVELMRWNKSLIILAAFPRKEYWDSVAEVNGMNSYAHGRSSASQVIHPSPR